MASKKRSRKQEPSIKEDFLSRLSRRNQHILALAILFILPVILFSSTVLGGKKFIGHDIIQWRAGAESVIEHRDETGQEPLWANNMFSGMPAYVVSYAKQVPQLDDLLFSTTKTIKPAVHFWVLAAGVYLLMVLFGINPFGAALTSLLVSFTTYIPVIIQAGHNTKFTTYVFIPWLLLGYLMMSRELKSKWLGFLITSLSAILLIRSNHPQVVYYFLYLLVFWWLYDTWKAYKAGRLANWGKITGLLAVAAALALMSNLQPYWSIFEYTPYSIRGGSELQEGQGGLDMDYAFRWSQGWGELGTLIVPNLYGGSSASGTYWGPKPGTSGPHYFGAIGFLFAVIGIIRSRRKMRFLFVFTGALTTLFSLGANFKLFNRLFFNYMPYFDKFRTPEMWLIVTVFCLAVLAAFGVEAVIELAKKHKKPLKQLYLPAGIAVGLGALIYLGSVSWIDFQKPGERQQYAYQMAQRYQVQPSNPNVQQAVDRFMSERILPDRVSKAQGDTGRYLLFVILGLAAIWLFVSRKIGWGYFAVSIIILAAIDLLTVDSRYLKEGTLVPQRTDSEQMVQQRQRDTDQFIRSNINHTEGWPYRVFPQNRNPFNNAVPAYFYPSIGGYTGAKISYYQELIENFLAARTPDSRILDMLNVKYMATQGGAADPSLQQVYQGQQGVVFENQDVLPKAFFVDSVITTQLAETSLNTLKNSSFDPATTAIVRVDEKGKTFNTQTDTSTSITITDYEPRNITMDVSRQNGGFMVLSEVYYPEGWRAFIDGEETPIYKTNYVLRGIEVPAGDHEISFTFHPTSHVWGVRISWMGNIIVWAIALITFVQLYRRRGNEEEETPVEDESSGE